MASTDRPRLAQCTGPGYLLKPTAREPVFIGVDFGTSGCRAVAIDRQENLIASAALPLLPSRRHRPGIAEQDARLWWQRCCELLQALGKTLRTNDQDRYYPVALSLDGTSGSLLLLNARGEPLAPAIMYDDQRGAAALALIRNHAPPQAAVHSATSSLAKYLAAADHNASTPPGRVLHQAEWLLARLTDRFNVGDENNSLKLGYDPHTRCWPDWLSGLGLNPAKLHQVIAAGAPIGRISESAARSTGLPHDLMVYAGTTDSTAAALAAGIRSVGDALTSLGSTLVLKIMAAAPVSAPEFGVYSHRIGDAWLVGGASNSGGSVLRAFFSDQEMASMTRELSFAEPSGLDYYPLLRPGERFPINDPKLPARLIPRPSEPLRFFQGLLEGIARIERQGYEALDRLGADYPSRVLSCGGGASNQPWAEWRATTLGVPVSPAQHTEAAYGSALLAKRGYLEQPVLGADPAQ